MSQQDFNLQELAHYLHLSPQQVEKLISREELPGRRVGGEWRFSRAEIHQWLEGRLGVYGEQELAQVEGAMDRHAVHGSVSLGLGELVSPELVRIPLQARTRDSVIREMVLIGAEAGLVWEPDRMADALRAREDLMSTAMENGVAILHPRRPMPSIIAEPFVALGLTLQGIPFGGGRRLTDVFFWVASTNDRGHLRTLARLGRVLQRESLLDELRHAPDGSAACELLRKFEGEMLE